MSSDICETYVGVLADMISSHMAYAISFSGVTPFTDPGGGAYCPTS